MSDTASRLQKIGEVSRAALARMFGLRKKRDRVINNLEESLDKRQADEVRKRLAR